MKKVNEEVFNIYDDYAHDKIERHEFIEKISVYAIGGLTVPAILDYLLPNYNQPEVTEDDERLKIKTIEYNSPKGDHQISGQLARPRGFLKKISRNNRCS